MTTPNPPTPFEALATEALGFAAYGDQVGEETRKHFLRELADLRRQVVDLRARVVDLQDQVTHHDSLLWEVNGRGRHRDA